MGGSIAVTLRRNGQEWRMDRWTNSLPGTIHDLDFLAGKPDSIQNYLQSWVDMAADWKANKATKAFALNMTPVYAPYPHGLKPSEYGLVVIDFDTSRILTCQEYSSIGSVDWMEFQFGPEAEKMNPGRAAMLRAFDARGRIQAMKGLVDTTKTQAVAEVLAFQGATMEYSGQDALAFFRIPITQGLEPLRALGARIADIYGQGMDMPIRFVQLSLDMAPFQVEEFDRCPTDIAAMRDRVEQLGFVLTDKERKAWDTWIKDLGR